MRRGRARQLRKVDWIASAIGRASETMPPNAVDGVNLIDLADLQDHNDNITVERMVGEYHLAAVECNSDYFARVYMGIAIRDCDEFGGVIFLNPENDEDADSNDWLWRRHILLSAQGIRLAGAGLDRAAGAIITTQEQAHFDIHVRRKMKGRDQLVLFTFYTVDNGAGNNLVQSFNFRTLVKLS